MKRENLKRLIKSANGAFDVTFIKQDQTERTMHAELGIEYNLKGGVNRVERADRPYMTVFDHDAQGYRNINLDTCTSLTVNGKTYSF